MCGHCLGQGLHHRACACSGHHGGCCCAHGGGHGSCCGCSSHDHGAGCCGERGARRGGCRDEEHGTSGTLGDQPQRFRRRFRSLAERVSELEAYLTELRAESESGAAYLRDVQLEMETVEKQLQALRTT